MSEGQPLSSSVTVFLAILSLLSVSIPLPLSGMQQNVAWEEDMSMLSACNRRQLWGRLWLSAVAPVANYPNSSSGGPLLATLQNKPPSYGRPFCTSELTPIEYWLLGFLWHSKCWTLLMPRSSLAMVHRRCPHLHHIDKKPTFLSYFQMKCARVVWCFLLFVCFSNYIETFL